MTEKLLAYCPNCGILITGDEEDVLCSCTAALKDTIITKNFWDSLTKAEKNKLRDIVKSSYALSDFEGKIKRLIREKNSSSSDISTNISEEESRDDTAIKLSKILEKLEKIPNWNIKLANLERLERIEHDLHFLYIVVLIECILGFIGGIILLISLL